MRLEFVQFFREAAAENGEAAPCFGIEVGVVEVEAGGVTFAFPLVATPKLEEAFDPSLVLVGWILREGFGDVSQDVFRAALVADGPLLDLVEERVGHEVTFVGLFGFAGPEFGSGLLTVDRGEGWDSRDSRGTSFFHPAEPVAKKGFVDAADGGQSAAGVAVHGGVADRGLRAIAGGEEEGVANVGEHPDAGGTDAGLDVLTCDVVLFPSERAVEVFFENAFVTVNERGDVPVVEGATESLRQIACCIKGGIAAVFAALIDTGKESGHGEGFFVLS